MLPLVLYAVVSAVTVRNNGLLPDRSFRSGLLAVSFFLTVGFAVIFLTSWGVDEFLHSLPPPDGMVPGDWAMLGFYLAFASELLLLILMVVVSYMVRSKLNRRRSSPTPLS